MLQFSHLAFPLPVKAGTGSFGRPQIQNPDPSHGSMVVYNLTNTVGKPIQSYQYKAVRSSDIRALQVVVTP